MVVNLCDIVLGMIQYTVMKFVAIFSVADYQTQIYGSGMNGKIPFISPNECVDKDMAVLAVLDSLVGENEACSTYYPAFPLRLTSSL